MDTVIGLGLVFFYLFNFQQTRGSHHDRSRSQLLEYLQAVQQGVSQSRGIVFSLQILPNLSHYKEVVSPYFVHNRLDLISAKHSKPAPPHRNKHYHCIQRGQKELASGMTPL